MVSQHNTVETLTLNGGAVITQNLSTSNVAGVPANEDRDAFGGRGPGGGFDKPDGDAPLSRGLRFGQTVIVPDSVDGLLTAQLPAGVKAEPQIAQAPTPAAPPPMPAAPPPMPAATPMSPADPFAAAPVAREELSKSKAAPAKKQADQAVDLVIAQVQDPNANSRWANQPGAIRAVGVKDGYVTTAAVNQLRPTGRRSLQVEVPLVGETYHFRKLKDHAVLDLALKRESSSAKTFQQTMFGAGLGAWALMALIARRRKSPVT